jgi:hypothetical protein
MKTAEEIIKWCDMLLCLPANVEDKNFLRSIKQLCEEQRWASVKDRLPDINEHHVSEPCIVYCENDA